MNALSIPTNTNTMTSTQLLEMLHFESKSSIHKAIKNMFSQKIDDSVIESSLNPNSTVNEYYLPELESKMFVAKHDINYLEKITQYWIDRKQELTPAQQLLQTAQSLVAQELKDIEQDRKLDILKVEQQNHTLKLKELEIHRRGGIPPGFLSRNESRHNYGLGLSKDMFRLIMKSVTIHEYMGTNEAGYDVSTFAYKESEIEPAISKYLSECKPKTKTQFVHIPTGKRFKFSPETN